MTWLEGVSATIGAAACVMALAVLQTVAQSTAVPPARPIIGGVQDCDDITAPVGAPVAGGREPLVARCLAGASLSYSEDGRVPLWVAERLGAHNRQVVVKRTKDSCPFKADEALRTSSHAPAMPDDYVKSGFDRGHMAPAADMTWSAQALSDSCLMSNIVPQVGIGMNRHIWADLESLVRDWACDFDDVVVITGPIFEQQPPAEIGKVNKVQVPTAFFKIVYAVQEPRSVVAFVLENRKIDKRESTAYDVLNQQRTSIQAIEQMTGLRFFPGLSPAVRTPLVKEIHPMLRRGAGCRKPAAVASSVAALGFAP